MDKYHLTVKIQTRFKSQHQTSFSSKNEGLKSIEVKEISKSFSLLFHEEKLIVSSICKTL